MLGSGDREGSGDVRLFECSAGEPEQDCSLVSTPLNCSLPAGEVQPEEFVQTRGWFWRLSRKSHTG